MAQQPVNSNTDTTVYTIVDNMPFFFGGKYEMEQYFAKMLRNPPGNHLEGTVYISFIVEKNGLVSNVRLLQGINPELDKEAIRMVTAMPYWSAGTKSGIPVRVSMVLPVNFVSNYNSIRNPNFSHGDSVYYDSRYMTVKERDRLKKEREKASFESWFMPGIAYSYYQPKGMDSIGHFSGLVVEYLIYAVVEDNDRDGPSHVRWYVKINMLQSSKANIQNLFAYSVGLDLSLEKNPKRNWLIPYFGLEFGGLSAKKLGTKVQFTPIFGLHILSRKNLFINAQGGYIYPIKEFDVYQGWIAQAGLNFALW